ncbi:hypothetical protein AaE_009412 [Aphanomyces astaci]|uniref:Reverse transcriptase domain-containing protein n=1 Tax=Aphanomyces astaci TaxID=112090 RepID=A0A6A5A399_APHAT|nr:hypothetical protein AaE_009412 [Aphanomyces astaci]
MGKGYWKMPKELVQYPQVREAIATEASRLLHYIRTAHNPGVVWHAWKKRTRRFLQDAHRFVRSHYMREKATAAGRLTEARRLHTEGHSTDQDLAEEEKIYVETEDLWKLYYSDLKFDVHAGKNERSTAHFFRPPTKLLYKTPVRSVNQRDGTVSTDPDAIQREFVDHWTRVMRDDDPAPPKRAARRRLLRVLQKRLTAEDRDALEEDITGSELQRSIETMAPHRTPGPDGFSACFYQVAPAVFGEILSIVFNYQLNRGILLKCQRTSEVVLLFKKNDRADPGNYRPISLMPVEVKILCRALSHRLSSLLPRLVLPAQKGFVHGQRLHDHTVFMLDLQHTCTVRNQEGYAAFLDFAKAYDRVSWTYLFDTLDTFGFGPKFIAWIRLLYTNPLVHLRINGIKSTPTHPNRGVKQGDPLSSLLFVLSLEPLNQLLHNHEEYGIELTMDHTATTLMFADDTTLLAGRIAHLQAQLELVSQFWC